VAKGKVTLEDQPPGDFVYYVNGYSFPGDIYKMGKDPRVVGVWGRLDSPTNVTPTLVTDNPRKLSELIGRETGLVLGPKVEETASFGVTGAHEDGTSTDQFLLSTRPELIKKSAPIGVIDVTRMSRAQLDRERATGTLGQQLKFDLKAH